MSIKKIQFVTSKPDVESCLQSNLPEYAFIGRSNVGKSSLINMLGNSNKLAKTSSTPGKTRLINYFLVNESWYLVDLPGYGYAKISKKDRENLSKIITGYITKRKNLICLFVLIDIRHAPLKSDIEFMEWLGINMVPFAMVYTKCDKLNSNIVEYKINQYRDEMKNTWENLPPYFITSAEKGMGKNELTDYIEGINKGL